MTMMLNEGTRQMSEKIEFYIKLLKPILLANIIS